MKLIIEPQKKLLLFILIFFVVNLLQSFYTGLLEDEAYYWVWSRELAWGYFDHPPMVALWAAIGSTLFSGELGIRLLSSVSFSLVIWIIWLLIDVKDKWQHLNLFLMLVISMALFQVFGFVITPDTPLLLFMGLFLLSYKRFLENESWLNSIFLGLSMAAMLYSKYHGILLIGFVVMSNLRLILKTKFWFAALTGVILFMPHLYWQYDNGFPSFIYHLQERNKRPYNINKTITHLLNMLVVVGLAFPVVYSAFYKYRAQNQFEKSLKFVVYGFFLFFLMTSFKSTPQAQWLLGICIPLLIIAFRYLIVHARPKAWLIRLGFIQLGILILARLLLAIPEFSPVVLEPHRANLWIPELEKKTEGKPVVFVNSYSKASIYRFYTGIQTHSYSVLRGRMSQYNLSDFEKNIQGKDVYSASTFLSHQPVLTEKHTRPLCGFPIRNYTTFENVKCLIQDEFIRFEPGLNTVSFNFINTYDKNINFEHVKFVGVFQGDKNKILLKVPLHVDSVQSVSPNETIEMKAEYKLDNLPSEEFVTFRVALEFYDLLEGFQGNKVPVKFKDQK